MQKIGLSFTGQLTYSEMLANVKVAHEIGFHSIWLAEHYFYRDAIASISALCGKFDSLVFGTGIISPYTRHLGLLAMSAQTVSEISGVVSCWDLAPTLGSGKFLELTTRHRSKPSNKQWRS